MNRYRTTLVVGGSLLALTALTVTASAAVIEALTIGASSSGAISFLAAGVGLLSLSQRRKRHEKAKDVR